MHSVFSLSPKGKFSSKIPFENRQMVRWFIHEELKKKPTAKELAGLDSISHVDLLDAVAIVLEEYSYDPTIPSLRSTIRSSIFLATPCRTRAPKVITVEKMKTDFGKIDFDRDFIARVREDYNRKHTFK